MAVDPSNPYTPAIREFARNTLAHLPAFFYHYLRKVTGVYKSTIKRLEECFYIESTRLEDYRLNSLVKSLRINIVAGCETNVNWHLIDNAHQLLDLLVPGTGKCGVVSHNTTDDIMQRAQ